MESTDDRWIPPQRASDAECVAMSWRYALSWLFISVRGVNFSTTKRIKRLKSGPVKGLSVEGIKLVTSCGPFTKQ